MDFSVTILDTNIGRNSRAVDNTDPFHERKSRVDLLRRFHNTAQYGRPVHVPAIKARAWIVERKPRGVLVLDDGGKYHVVTRTLKRYIRPGKPSNPGKK